MSLTTVSPCKNEWKIWMIVSLYSNDQKIDSTINQKQVQTNYNDQKWDSMNESKISMNDWK